LEREWEIERLEREWQNERWRRERERLRHTSRTERETVLAELRAAERLESDWQNERYMTRKGERRHMQKSHEDNGTIDASRTEREINFCFIRAQFRCSHAQTRGLTVLSDDAAMIMVAGLLELDNTISAINFQSFTISVAGAEAFATALKVDLLSLFRSS